ncbi:MAG: MATE family efflux transporter [Ruminococcaceae bacterium]|nr:MATE family efflux transporter [Oscillospiraceae bacterium]
METVNQSNYLGKEKLSKLLVKFAIPCILSLIISCLYNIVDQIFVGNMVGTAGNAATGIIFPITVVGWGASLFFGDGAAAFLSMALGKGETKKIPASVGNAVLMSFVSGIIIIAVAYIGGDGLLTVLGAKDAETLQLASDYGKIIYAMIPLALVQNCLASIIRADGSPKVAMAAMFTGAIINIIGDPIFISFMGISGAAVATILGQFVSFIMCASYLFRSKNFKVNAKSFVPQGKLLGSIMALGTSSFLTQVSIVVITIVNNILLVEYGAMSPYGTVIPLSAFVVIMKLFQIILNIAIGIAAGAQPIVGYNFGAKLNSRVRELLKLILKYTAIVCIVATVFIEAFPSLFIKMFGSDSELYMEFATSCLRIYLSLILFTCLQKVSAIFLQSIGKAHLAAPLSLLRDVLLIIASLIVPIKFGVTGIFWAAPIADVIAFVITLFVMLHVYKSLKTEDGKPDESGEAQAIKESVPGLIITIAREHGSAGKQIGKLVAEKLGIPFYYKEMTALAAQESGLDKEFISDINVNAPAALHSLYLSTEVVQQAVVAQDKVIRKIADQGSCVIVGRAADYVLRDYSNVVNIFIYAPEDYRIRKVMEVYGDSEEEAKKNIRRSDEARGAYYKNISGMTWGDRHNYKLLIDSSIGAEVSADAICRYVQNGV